MITLRHGSGSLEDSDFNNGFSNWETNNPNVKHAPESCTVMAKSGRWNDIQCFHQQSAIMAQYVHRVELQTSLNHPVTDLASVRNLSENKQISALLSGYSWIGLHRKTWPYWSDKSPNIFTKWATDRPEYTERTQQYCASVSTASGKWVDTVCGATHHFFCQSFPPHQHEARFKLKFQSEADLNDPAVQQQILEQLHAKLEKHGVSDLKLRWTQTDGRTFHKARQTNEPNNKHTTEGCTVMTTAGRWQDYRCWLTVPSVCYNEPGPTKYILVETLKTWHEAMAYCRSKYTDLASVRNLSENNQISSLLSGYSWIGLHRKTWPYWSDKSPNIFTKWATDNPVSTTRTQLSCASVSTTSGKWHDIDCGTNRHFFCQSLPPHQHEARFKLKFQSEADLNDPAVQQQILEQVHCMLNWRNMESQTLSSAGLRRMG
ncbi:hypothetical protein F7725_024784 [Dissostichus mawsoni]|uniref:C-type lectin domain-containing protein n=1 Tax=Dissostichus mawsoni TaxID=36200 RepID=A0A7J5X996_DISMA|nr:hypothetical protein F7725_024784 [Dissostichus mawsoni]